MNPLHVVSVSILAWALLGCGTLSPLGPMKRAPELSLLATPRADAARVVFLWECDDHRGRANPRMISVVDEHGTLLGDVVPDTWFSTELPPGEHLLVGYDPYVVGDHATSVVRATLAAGRTYFVGMKRQGRTLVTYGHLALTRAPLPPAPQVRSSFEPYRPLASLELDPTAAETWRGHGVAARLEEARALVAAGKFEAVREADGLLVSGPDATHGLSTAGAGP